MIKKDTYFVSTTPFRVLKKGITKVLMVSDKGDYRKLEPVPKIDFEEGDYIIKRTLIGKGCVEVDYAKMEDLGNRKYFSNR